MGRTRAASAFSGWRIGVLIGRRTGSDRAPAASRPSFLLRPKDGSRGRASGQVQSTKKAAACPAPDRLAGSPSDDSGFTCLAFGADLMNCAPSGVRIMPWKAIC